MRVLIWAARVVVATAATVFCVSPAAWGASSLTAVSPAPAPRVGCGHAGVGVRAGDRGPGGRLRGHGIVAVVWLSEHRGAGADVRVERRGR